jgi:hypothetical protein
MKKFCMIMMMMLSSFFLISCSQQEEEEKPQFLDVQLTVNPEKAQVEEDVTFEAKVFYGSEEVEDADEVKFEIWRANADEHEKVIVEHSENGIYRLKRSFGEEGTYYIISHVTARSMHNMPKAEFIVGNPSEPEEGNDSDGMEMDEEEHTGH